MELHRDRLVISGERKSESERTSPRASEGAATGKEGTEGKEGGKEGGKYVIRERSYGRFEQTLMVPEGTEVSHLYSFINLALGMMTYSLLVAQVDKIKAKVENGVLTVTFPRTASATEEVPKKITIG